MFNARLLLMLCSACSTTAALAEGSAPTAPASPVADIAPRPDVTALQQALAARMQKAVAEGFSGSVLIANGTQVLFEQQYGLADPAAGTAVTADTRFNLASTGKLFTAVAVMQLVQQGKLDLDQPVGRYLPDWPVAAVREKVTARHLLTHTSGLGSFWGAQFEAARGGLQRLADYRPLLQQAPAFEPGSDWDYSNSGFLVLGLIIEAVSGEDFYSYMQKHVFDPAGMGDSGYFAVDGKAERVAVPQRGAEAGDTSASVMPEPRGSSAGGGYSTPRDLLKFNRALTGGKLLDAATTTLLFAPVVLPPSERRRGPQGLGVLRYADGNDIAYAHPGGAPGIAVEFRAGTASGWTLIIMSNNAGRKVMQIGGDIAGLIARSGGQDLRIPNLEKKAASKPAL